MTNRDSTYRIFTIFFFLILLASSLISSVSGGEKPSVIKVRITPLPPWSLKFNGMIDLYYRNAEGLWVLLRERMDSQRTWRISQEEHGLVLQTELGDRIVSAFPVRFTPLSGTKRINLNGREYAGELELWPEEGRQTDPGEGLTIGITKGLTFFNCVELEDYVQGVLAGEAYAGWNPQALAAQAVAVRSYTLYNLGKHGDYDFCDQTHCQRYLGFSPHPAFTAAVEETKGEVLTWKGQVINAVYHSSSGGHTKNNEDVWEGPPLAYLRGVADFDQGGKNYSWARTPLFSVREFSAKLGFSGNSRLVVTPHFNEDRMLIGLTFQEKDSGLVKHFRNEEVRWTFALQSSNFQVFRVKKEDFAASFQQAGLVSIGPAVVSNGYLSLQAEIDLEMRGEQIQAPVLLSGDDYLLFVGKGSGHGVGLSQWGTQAMAERGHKYQTILEYYYGKDLHLTKIEQ